MSVTPTPNQKEHDHGVRDTSMDPTKESANETISLARRCAATKAEHDLIDLAEIYLRWSQESDAALSIWAKENARLRHEVRLLPAATNSPTTGG